VLYPVTIVDCAPGVGARDPVQRVIHQMATDLLAVLLPRRVDHEQAKRMLKYVGQQCPGVPLTVVLNRMLHRLDEGAHCARQQVSVGPTLAAQIELPADDALQRQLDAAVLDVDGLAQATRIGLKQLVVSLAEAWV
jgi:MinD superfamily P-loop ATPase